MLNQTLTTKNIENIFPDNLFLIAGGREGSPSNTFEPSDAFIAKRLTKDNIAKVINRNNWIINTVYDVWTPETESTNYYVFNSNNDIIYVCVGNNPNGRVDQHGNYLSTQEPIHTNGVQTYSDGYSWLVLFKLDYTQDLFLTGSEIPIPNWSTTKNYNTLNLQYASDCSSGSTSFGACCLYYTKDTKDAFTGITHLAGDLTDITMFSTCYECSEFAKRLNKEKVFINGVTAGGITVDHTYLNPLCGATVAVKTLITDLTNNINYINSNSSANFQYNLINNQNTRGIVSASINLGNLKPSERRITKANPAVVVIDPEGAGADIQLLTTPISYGIYEIYGIRVNAPGSGYVFPSFYIDGYQSSSLNDLINLYIYPDNVFEDPTKMIPTTTTVVRCELLEDDIRSTIINNKLIKFALMTDPVEYATGTSAVYAEGDTSIYSMQSKVLARKTENYTVTPTSSFISTPPTLITPENGEIENMTKNSYKAYVSAIKNTDGKIFNGSVWIDGWELSVNDTPEAFTVNDEINIQGVSHTVISVETPVLDKNISYFSVTPTDIELSEISTNKSYSATIRVNT